MIAGQGALATIATALAAGILAAGAALVLLLWKDPLAPLLLIGGAGAASVALALAGRPLLTLHAALFLLLLPSGLRIEPLYTLATNGALLLAFGLWLLRGGEAVETQWSATCRLLVLFLLWAALGLLWAPSLMEGRRELIAWIIGFLLLFLLVNRARSLVAIDGLMLTLALYGWMIVAAALYTVLFTGYSPSHRLRVLDINENMLGILLILMLPGVMWPVLRATGSRRAGLMTVSIAYILFTLAFTALSGSRGSTISLVLILFTFVFSPATRPWGLVGLCLVGLGLAGAPFLLDLVLQRFMQEEGGELGGRGDLWEASIVLIGDHAWTGVGIGNGPLALHAYIAALSSGHNARVDLPSHQPFLEVGVDTGLPGIAVYTAILASALWSFVRSRAAWGRLTGAPAGYHVIVAGVTAGYLVSWIKGGGIKNHPSFFLILALLLIPAHLVRAAGARPPSIPGRSGTGADHA